MKDIKTLSFEEAMAEYESISDSLESGSVKLDEAMKLYERGVALHQYCADRLEKAKLKVEKITTQFKGEESQVSLEPLDAHTA
jgi:exodeoxyribonuclease VII small subunit